MADQIFTRSMLRLMVKSLEDKDVLGLFSQLNLSNSLKTDF